MESVSRYLKDDKSSADTFQWFLVQTLDFIIILFVVNSTRFFGS